MTWTWSCCSICSSRSAASCAARRAPQLCARCRAALPRLAAPLCARCGAPTAWPVARCRECAGRRLAFAPARAAVAYDDAVRRARRGLEGARPAPARRRRPPSSSSRSSPRPEVEALAFVPPDRDRSSRRGHHPAERLARELGARWGLPVEPLLAADAARSRASAGWRSPSAGATCAARSGAVGRVPAAVVLVDDVYTTGATANAAASALRKAGARRVEVVTFARAIR